MVAVSHLVGPATLPSATLSVLSYNVLLPNSVDGWWTYKNYFPPLNNDDRHIASWEYRRDLLRRRLSIVDADVVCFQEVAPDSFDEDFSFMTELGYDGVEMYRKGRFRPATFWKSSKCQLAAEPIHKDRSLLTAFTILEGEQQPWHVLNCHLQAGFEGKRRLRQINEGVRAAMTLARKLKEPEPSTTLRLIVCGDFNGGPECGAIRYLEDGFVNPDFLEDGESITSGKKELPLAQPMIDVAGAVTTREPPPTLVVPELISLVVRKGTEDSPKLSSDLVERLSRIFDQLATHTQGSDKYMSVADVEKWLVAINGMIGRGSEYREAARQMGWKDPELDMTANEVKARITIPHDGLLSFNGFLTVYSKELIQGKFWGIAHDLAVLGEPLPQVGIFKGRYDRMYCSAALRPTAVLDTVCERPCPNDEEPSDHLPVAASFSPVN